MNNIFILIFIYTYIYIMLYNDMAEVADYQFSSFNF